MRFVWLDLNFSRNLKKKIFKYVYIKFWAVKGFFGEIRGWVDLPICKYEKNFI